MVSIYKNSKETGGQTCFHWPLISNCNWHILTWDNFIKGYVSSKSNFAVLWQWLAAWKPLKLGSHVSWRRLCVIFRIYYSRYLKLVATVPRAFYLPCHREELEKRIGWNSLSAFQKFSQKEFDSIKLETIF